MKSVVIDYGLCNLLSVYNALKFLGVDSVVTSDSTFIKGADIAILPGVGAFEDGMGGLKAKGLIQPIYDFIKTGKPFLGICLGMQMLMDKSYEFGEHGGLGIIEGEVLRFQKESLDGKQRLKIPHIGWNVLVRADLSWEKTPLAGIKEGDEMYFVHSYCVVPKDRRCVLAQTAYGGHHFCSVVQKENVFGCQFHPEKSSKSGLKILKEFMELAK